MNQKLDLRQIGTIFGHALYVDVADMPEFRDDGEVLSNRDKAEFQVRTSIQEAFGMPATQPTMIEEAPMIQTVCPVVDCKAVYTSRYSPELNHFPEAERKTILKKARMNQEAKAKMDHGKGKHDISKR